MWSDGAVVIVKKSGNKDMADAIEGAIVKWPNGTDELTQNKLDRLETDQFIKGTMLYYDVGRKENVVKRMLESGWACLYWLTIGRRKSA